MSQSVTPQPNLPQEVDFFTRIRSTIAIVLRQRTVPVFKDNDTIEAQEDTVGHGSGFVCEFQGGAFLVTAAHVIRGLKKPEFLKVALKNNSGEWIEERIETPLAVDEARDIAILSLKVRSEVCCPAIIPEPAHNLSSRLKIGVEVYYYGFPYLREPGRYTPVVQKGMIAGLDQRRDGRDYYILQGTANPGNSGGPVFTIDGEVIGIVIEYVPPLQQARLAILDGAGNLLQSMDKPSGLSLVVPINHGIAMLKEASKTLPSHSQPAPVDIGSGQATVAAIKVEG